jgi:hypothetical protein
VPCLAKFSKQYKTFPVYVSYLNNNRTRRRHVKLKTGFRETKAYLKFGRKEKKGFQSKKRKSIEAFVYI